jgi:hypothetical protein
LIGWVFGKLSERVAQRLGNKQTEAVAKIPEKLPVDFRLHAGLRTLLPQAVADCPF